MVRLAHTQEHEAFDACKTQILRDLQNLVDKSPKGALDAPIKGFLEWLNTLPDYVSTSSCSGRISLFYIPQPSTTNGRPSDQSCRNLTDEEEEGGLAAADPNEKGSEDCEDHPSTSTAEYSGKQYSYKGSGQWLLAAHRTVSPDEVIELVQGCSTDCSRLLLKVEPFILHVQCRDIASAKRLLNIANQSGFRESGIVIGKKFMVHVRSTANTMQVPLVLNGNHIVPRASFRLLVEYANNRFNQNLRKVTLFERNLRENLMDTDVVDKTLPPGQCQVDPRDLARWGLSFSRLKLRDGKEIGVLYGGCGGSNMQRLTSVVIFDPSKEEWTYSACRSRDQLPAARIKHAACVLPATDGEQLVVHGGRTSPSNALGDLWSLTVEKLDNGYVHEWHPMSKPHEADTHLPCCWGHQMVPISEKEIVLFGGRNTDHCFASLLKITFFNNLHGQSTFSVANLARNCSGVMPGPRYGHAMCTGHDSVYVHGGYTFARPDNISRERGTQNRNIASDKHLSGRLLGDFFELHVPSLTWSTPPLTDANPSPRFFHHIIPIGGGKPRSLLIFGGTTANSAEQGPYKMEVGSWRCRRISFVPSNQSEMVKSETKRALSYLSRSGCSTFSHGGGNSSFQLVTVGGGGLTFSFGAFYCPPLALDLESFCCRRLLSLSASEGLAESRQNTEKLGLELCASRKGLVVPIQATEPAKVILAKDGLLDQTEKIRRYGRARTLLDKRTYDSFLRLNSIASQLPIVDMSKSLKNSLPGKSLRRKEKKDQRKRYSDSGLPDDIDILMWIPISAQGEKALDTQRSRDIPEVEKGDEISLFRSLLYSYCPIAEKPGQQEATSLVPTNPGTQSSNGNIAEASESWVIVPKQAAMHCSELFKFIGILDLKRKMHACSSQESEKILAALRRSDHMFCSAKGFIEQLTRIPLTLLRHLSNRSDTDKKPKKLKPISIPAVSWFQSSQFLRVPYRGELTGALSQHRQKLLSIDGNFDTVIEHLEDLATSPLLIQAGTARCGETHKQPRRQSLLERVQVYLKEFMQQYRLPIRLETDIPNKLEFCSDALMLSPHSLVDPLWEQPKIQLGDSQLVPRIWQDLAQLANARIVTRRSEIAQSCTRDSRVELLFGDDPWVTIKENGILYTLDITKVMFSTGNDTEKARVASFPAEGETVVDLYAGIGYFTIPYLIHAKVAHVHACDINPAAMNCLEKNVRLNGVEDRVSLYLCDNQELAARIPNVADRVNLGLLPSSEDAWSVAVQVMKERGGWMHVHGNINKKEARKDKWGQYVRDEIQRLSSNFGKRWTVSCHSIVRVKSYAPNILHCVADIHCFPAMSTLEQTTKQIEEIVRSDLSRTSGFRAGDIASATSLCSPSLDLLNEHTVQYVLWARRRPLLLQTAISSDIVEAFRPCNLLARGDKSGETRVSAHVSANARMDFTDKNFCFQNMTFQELLQRCENTKQDTGSIYLRAVGDNPRRTRAHFWKDFPDLSRSLPFQKLKWLVPSGAYFSSVFRVASPGMTLWTHYDVMDNVLVQLHGKKRVILFPPSVSDCLYLKGSSSKVLNWDFIDTSQFPLAPYARKNAVEFLMREGDVLFIPSLWCHSVTSVSGTSIAVNVFWKDNILPDELRNPKDLYGNADPLPVTEAEERSKEASKLLSTLPNEYYDFYVRKVLSESFGHEMKVDPVQSPELAGRYIVDAQY
eukprot:gb/GECG01007825.1/.p1 GENE.gb/GECG01007825.1/~~gb/GECG01007825.1/.p1  ORF type:complete len:1688 (+),score=172.13 gb/GECG01007825.1/:1-5064(+)